MNKKSMIEPIMDALRKWRQVDAIGRGAFTQVQAACLLGVPLKTYQDWEQGASAPAGFARKALLAAIKRHKAPKKKGKKR